MTLKNTRKIEIKILGMTCAGCVATLEKALNSLNSVLDVWANLDSESILIEYDFARIKYYDLEKAIRETGYQTINEKVIIRVGEMTCASCVKTIEESLLKLEGIVKANVDLAGGKVQVVYNPDLISPIIMKKTIEESGYKFLGREGEETEDLVEVIREKDLKIKRRLIIIMITSDW